MSAVKFSCILLIVYNIQSSMGIVDYCSLNQFNSNSSFMQFTKEVSEWEYTEKGRFKGLHCCSKGYRSIEWYKDGRPYPWASEVSSFIIYPESENQTIYAQETTGKDSGNYTCIVRNDTQYLERPIHLKVIDTLPDSPKTTFFPVDQHVEIGKSARLFCEAFVGLVNLPDAQNGISWRRHTSNNHSLVSEGRLNIEVVKRENQQIIGAYLTITDVKSEDFGEYICRISNPDTYIEMRTWLREFEHLPEPILNPIPWKMIMFASVVIVLVLVKLFLLYIRFGLSARVNLKDRFGPVNSNDGKQTDVLICHSEEDWAVIAESFIKPLENSYKYVCQTKVFPKSMLTWPESLNQEVSKSRHVIAILSQHTIRKWDVPNLSAACEQLLKLNGSVSCVLLEPLPLMDQQSQTKNQNGKSFSNILQDLHTLYYDGYQVRQFWLLLRLRLPPKRNSMITQQKTLRTEPENRMPKTSNDSLRQKRLNNFVHGSTSSQESLEILV